MNFPKTIIYCLVIGVEIEFYLNENINVEKFELFLGVKVKKEEGNNQYEN